MAGKIVSQLRNDKFPDEIRTTWIDKEYHWVYMHDRTRLGSYGHADFSSSQSESKSVRLKSIAYNKLALQQCPMYN